MSTISGSAKIKYEVEPNQAQSKFLKENVLRKSRKLFTISNDTANRFRQDLSKEIAEVFKEELNVEAGGYFNVGYDYGELQRSIAVTVSMSRPSAWNVATNYELMRISVSEYKLSHLFYGQYFDVGRKPSGKKIRKSGPHGQRKNNSRLIDALSRWAQHKLGLDYSESLKLAFATARKMEKQTTFKQLKGWRKLDKVKLDKVELRMQPKIKILQRNIKRDVINNFKNRSYGR